MLGALVVVGLASLAACGGSSSSPSVSTVAPGGTTAPTGSTVPSQDIAADKAAAEAASLKLSDFPTGWTSTPQSDTSGYPNVDAEIAKCLGVSEEELNHKGPAHVDSPDFSDANNNTVSSSVGYAPSVPQAQHEFAIISSPKVPACLGPAVEKLVTYAANHPSNASDTLPAGTTFGTPTVAPMSFPTFGDESVAYRVTIPVNTKSLTVSFYLDTVTARKGRAGAGLDFEGVGTPFPSDQEEHYTTLVVDRMANT
jgi:hypothetical protein